MHRSIKQLQNAEALATEEQIRAAALQFVRKVSGYRKPSKINQASFDQAVEEVIAVMQKLLDNLSIHFERYLQKANLAGLWVAEEGSVVGMAGLCTVILTCFLISRKKEIKGGKMALQCHGHTFCY